MSGQFDALSAALESVRVAYEDIRAAVPGPRDGRIIRSLASATMYELRTIAKDVDGDFDYHLATLGGARDVQSVKDEFTELVDL